MMRRNSFTRHALTAGAIAMTLAVTLAAGPAWAADAKTTEPSAWDQVKTFAHTEKKAAVKSGQHLLAATDRQIASMKKAVKTSNVETKAAYEANIADLQAKKKATKAELARLSKASAKTWDATKEGFGKAYQDLHDSYGKAKAAATKG